MFTTMFECSLCPESFFSRYSLIAHMKKHEKEGGVVTVTNVTNLINNHVNPSSTSTAFNHSSSVARAILRATTDPSGKAWLQPQTQIQWASTPTITITPQRTEDRNFTTVSTIPIPDHFLISTTHNQLFIKTEDGDPGLADITLEPLGDDGGGDSDDNMMMGHPSSEEAVLNGTIHKSNKTYECPTCHKVFRSYPGLRYHRNSQHDQNGPHKCNYCDKRFCQKSHLTRHETIHTGEKNYACSYCDKTFRIKGNLQIHVRIHTGEKPYACGTCGKTFTQQQSAKAHEKLHLKYK